VYWVRIGQLPALITRIKFLKKFKEFLNKGTFANDVTTERGPKEREETLKEVRFKNDNFS
jgi:hypothetical protein